MAIYLGGDGYRWHPWAHSNPIKQELHLRRHDQLDSAGNSREAQNISWNKNECQPLSSQWRLQIHFKKTFLGCTIMKTFNESLVYLKSNLEEMIGQWLNYNMNERASNYRSMCLQKRSVDDDNCPLIHAVQLFVLLCSVPTNCQPREILAWYGSGMNKRTHCATCTVSCKEITAMITSPQTCKCKCVEII